MNRRYSRAFWYSNNPFLLITLSIYKTEILIHNQLKNKNLLVLDHTRTSH
jgi:hypothetical protein